MAKTFEQRLDNWIAAAEAAGHELARNEDGDIDMFRVDIGFHNGPQCVRCGESWCEHCTAPDRIERCEATPA